MSSDNFHDKYSRLIEKNKSRTIALRIIGLLFIVLGVASTLFFNFNLQKQNTNIADSLTSQNVIVDSLVKETDSVNIRRDTITKIIKNFLRVKEDTINIAQFYADTMERYYLKKNITLEQVKQERKVYNIKHKPAQIKVGNPNITLDLSKIDTIEALVNVPYISSGIQRELIYQLKFNSNNKIFYVRNLLPKNE